jgi:hypothetical protein
MFDPRTRKLTTSLLTALAIAALPGIARAAKLTSGFLISSNATRMGCLVLNAGAVAVKITKAQILLPSGYANTSYETCTGKLLDPGKSCSISGDGQLLAGQVQVEGGTKHLRGTCMLLTTGNDLIGMTEMR